MKKINWINVLLFIVFIVSSILVINDIYTITLKSVITGQYYGFTWFGLVTFTTELFVAIGIGVDIYDKSKDC